MGRPAKRITRTFAAPAEAERISCCKTVEMPAVQLEDILASEVMRTVQEVRDERESSPQWEVEHCDVCASSDGVDSDPRREFAWLCASCADTRDDDKPVTEYDVAFDGAHADIENGS